MTGYETLRVNRRDRALDVVLNRPERQNALTRTMIGELHRALDAAEADPDVRLLVLAGEGDSFCAGMDFVEAGATEAAAQALRPTVEEFYRLLERFTQSRVVIAAQVTGRVTAGGVGLVAATDYAIAGPGATFQLSEVIFGLLPATIAPFIIRRCGWQAAFRLSLTAQRIDAQRAAGLALVDDAVDNPADAMRQFMVRAARVPPHCVRDLKGLFREMWIINDETRRRAVDVSVEQIMRPETHDSIRRFVHGTRPS